MSESLEPNSDYFLKYQHLYSKAYAMFLSDYNIELKAVFVPGSHEKFLALCFNKLSKFHSDTMFKYLGVLIPIQKRKKWVKTWSPTPITFLNISIYIQKHMLFLSGYNIE